jgi:hypothetical protein
VVIREELERPAGGAFPLSLASGGGRLNAVPRESFAIGDTVRVKNACRRPIPSRTQPPTIFMHRTSPPTTSASGPRIYGRKPPTGRVGVFESYLEKAL